MDAYSTAAAETLPSSRSRSTGVTPECEYDPRRIDKKAPFSIQRGVVQLRRLRQPDDEVLQQKAIPTVGAVCALESQISIEQPSQ